MKTMDANNNCRPIHGSERLPTREDADENGNILICLHGCWFEQQYDDAEVTEDDWWMSMPPAPIDTKPSDATSPELPQEQSTPSGVLPYRDERPGKNVSGVVTRKIYDQRVAECEQLRKRVEELEEQVETTKCTGTLIIKCSIA